MKFLLFFHLPLCVNADEKYNFNLVSSRMNQKYWENFLTKILVVETKRKLVISSCMKLIGKK
jgi:hypothetical protein